VSEITIVDTAARIIMLCLLKLLSRYETVL